MEADIIVTVGEKYIILGTDPIEYVWCLKNHFRAQKILSAFEYRADEELILHRSSIDSHRIIAVFSPWMLTYQYDPRSTSRNRASDMIKYYMSRFSHGELLNDPALRPVFALN